MGFPWGAILSQILTLFLQALIQPFFLIVVVLIWLQTRRLLQTREALFGVRGSILRPLLAAIGYGILGGLIGSVLMVVLGISLNDLGILWLWGIAILLMLISPRLLCFSYSGGILALVSLLTGYPKLNIPALMGLVAVLHLIESVLILASGHIDPLPVYVRNRFGRVVGAFNLQKFWPIPLVVITVMGLPSELPHMPDWWPLLRPLGALSAQAAYGLLPVIAALGYGELAITCLPRERVRLTSLHLALFSLVLLCLAILAAYIPQTAILAALFSPLGHEVVIRVGQRSELQGKPRFVPPARGVMVLDALRGSPSRQAGLRSGDVILKIADIPVNSRSQFAYVLDVSGPTVDVEYQQEPGHLKRTRITVDPNGPSDLTARCGMVLVPEPNDPPTVDIATSSPLQGIYRRLAHLRLR